MANKYYYSVRDRVGIKHVSEMYADSLKDAKKKLRDAGFQIRQLWTEQGDPCKFCKGPTRVHTSLSEPYQYSLRYRNDDKLVFGCGYKALAICLAVLLIGILVLFLFHYTLLTWFVIMVLVFDLSMLITSYFRLVKVVIDKSKRDIIFSRKLFFGMCCPYTERIRFNVPCKVILIRKYFVEISVYLCDAYFVELHCDTGSYLISESAYYKHELKLAQQVADFLEIPLVNKADHPEVWPKLDGSYTGMSFTEDSLRKSKPGRW